MTDSNLTNVERQENKLNTTERNDTRAERQRERDSERNRMKKKLKRRKVETQFFSFLFR